MRRKLSLIVIAMSLVMSTGVITYGESIQLVYDGQTHVYDAPPISLYVNNKRIETKVMAPISIDGRVLVPAREVFEPMGAKVEWYATEKKVVIQYNNSQITLFVNDTEALLNGKTVELDVPAKIINDKVMIPVRFISETMGFDVSWDSTTYSVLINEKHSEDSTKPEDNTKPEQDQEEIPVAPKENLTYIDGSQPIIELNKVSNLNKGAIQVTDLYREKKLIIDLGDDYSSELSNSVLNLNNSKISTIEVVTNGTTKLTITTKTVYTYNLYQNDTTIQIELVKPNEKYSQIVVIDPGHGGSDSGAAANGIKEKDLNFKHAMAVYERLEQDPNIKVYITREEDVYPTLQFRTALANDIGSHIFVSFHNNSASGAAQGTETLYYPSTQNTLSKQIAQIVQDNIIKYVGTANRGIKPRADLYVLRTTSMPAVLIETGFITNAQEAALINSPEFINKFGQGVYEAIVSCFDIL